MNRMVSDKKACGINGVRDTKVNYGVNTAILNAANYEGFGEKKLNELL